jgi:hypothetical protein
MFQKIPTENLCATLAFSRAACYNDSDTCGVRVLEKSGIHEISSGALVGGAMQGLHLCGKTDAFPPRTHLLKAGYPFFKLRHRRMSFLFVKIF